MKMKRRSCMLVTAPGAVSKEDLRGYLGAEDSSCVSNASLLRHRGCSICDSRQAFSGCVRLLGADFASRTRTESHPSLDSSGGLSCGGGGMRSAGGLNATASSFLSHDPHDRSGVASEATSVEDRSTNVHRGEYADASDLPSEVAFAHSATATIGRTDEAPLQSHVGGEVEPLSSATGRCRSVAEQPSESLEAVGMLEKQLLDCKALLADAPAADLHRPMMEKPESGHHTVASDVYSPVEDCSGLLCDVTVRSSSPGRSVPTGVANGSYEVSFQRADDKGCFRVSQSFTSSATTFDASGLSEVEDSQTSGGFWDASPGVIDAAEAVERQSIGRKGSVASCEVDDVATVEDFRGVTGDSSGMLHCGRLSRLLIRRRGLPSRQATQTNRCIRNEAARWGRDGRVRTQKNIDTRSRGCRSSRRHDDRQYTKLTSDVLVQLESATVTLADEKVSGSKIIDEEGKSSLDFFWSVKHHAEMMREKTGVVPRPAAFRTAEQSSDAMGKNGAADVVDGSCWSRQSSEESTKGTVNHRCRDDNSQINLCENPSDLWYGLKTQDGEPVVVHARSNRHRNRRRPRRQGTEVESEKPVPRSCLHDIQPKHYWRQRRTQAHRRGSRMQSAGGPAENNCVHNGVQSHRNSHGGTWVQQLRERESQVPQHAAAVAPVSVPNRNDRTRRQKDRKRARSSSCSAQGGCLNQSVPVSKDWKKVERRRQARKGESRRNNSSSSSLNRVPDRVVFVQESSCLFPSSTRSPLIQTAPPPWQHLRGRWVPRTNDVARDESLGGDGTRAVDAIASPFNVTDSSRSMVNLQHGSGGEPSCIRAKPNRGARVDDSGRDCSLNASRFASTSISAPQFATFKPPAPLPLFRRNAKMKRRGVNRSFGTVLGERAPIRQSEELMKSLACDTAPAAPSNDTDRRPHSVIGEDQTGAAARPLPCYGDLDAPSSSAGIGLGKSLCNVVNSAPSREFENNTRLRRPVGTETGQSGSHPTRITARERVQWHLARSRGLL